MPMIILFSRNDPEACRGLAMQMLGDDAGCRLARSTANVTLGAADRGKCERRVAVDEAYTPSGCLLLDVEPVPDEGAPGQNVQAGQVEVAKGAAVLRQVDMRRRGIVVHRADRLARHLQHALRKIIESTSASAVFVLTSQRLEGMDPALLSRAIVVNCTTAALAAAPPVSHPGSLHAHLQVFAACHQGKGGTRSRASKSHRALLRHAAQHGRASTIASIIGWAAAPAPAAAPAYSCDRLGALVAAAAAADHAAATMPGHGSADDLVVRIVLASLVDQHAAKHHERAAHPDLCERQQ